MREFVLNERRLLNEIKDKVYYTEFPVVGAPFFALSFHSILKKKYRNIQENQVLDMFILNLNNIRQTGSEYKKRIEAYLEEAKSYEVKDLEGKVLIVHYPFRNKFYENFLLLEDILKGKHVIFSEEILKNQDVIGMIEKMNNRVVNIYSNVLDRGKFLSVISSIKDNYEYCPIYELGSEVKNVDIRIISKNLYYNLLRRFMSKRVDYKINESISTFGVYIDEKILGCFALGDDIGANHFGNNNMMIMMLSDFVLIREKYFAKLVIMLTLSKEVQDYVNQRLGRFYDGIITIVFSDNPESMKYRGVYDKILSQKLNNRQYRIVYNALFTEKTILEVVEEWKKSYLMK